MNSENEASSSADKAKLSSSLTVILSALALSASASMRPEGPPDGIYVEVVHVNGTAAMEYYGPANSTAPVYALDKRAGVGAVCQTLAMARSDIVAAVNGLAGFFGGGNAFYGKSVSVYNGGAVAYGCNYGKGQTMDANTFLDFMGDLDTNCGDTHAGYYNHPDWDASYGRTQSSQSFC